MVVLILAKVVVTGKSGDCYLSERCLWPIMGVGGSEMAVMCVEECELVMYNESLTINNAEMNKTKSSSGRKMSYYG